jgi:hypothetical protein
VSSALGARVTPEDNKIMFHRFATRPHGWAVGGEVPQFGDDGGQIECCQIESLRSIDQEPFWTNGYSAELTNKWPALIEALLILPEDVPCSDSYDALAGVD